MTLPFNDRRFRFLCVGVINTLFGYAVSVLLYWALSPTLHILVIITIANIINISFSFVTLKLFVFRTKGHWLVEYIRCYLVYGLSMAIGTVTIWFFVDILTIPFWLSQIAVITGTVIISYIGHTFFSFARPKKKATLAKI